MITPRHYSRPRRQQDVQQAYEWGRVLERLMLGGVAVALAVGMAVMVAVTFHHATVQVAALFPH
jgi:hypothetical protein